MSFIRPIFPGELEKMNTSFKSGFSSTLRELAKSILIMEEGYAAENIVAGLSDFGVDDGIILKLTNETAAKLINYSADVIESSKKDKFISCAISADGTLVSLVFDSFTGDSKFYRAKIDNHFDTIAGELFLSVYVRKVIEKLASEQDADVLWDVAEFFCDMNLGE